MKYSGFVSTGDPRSSQSIDEIVYGTSLNRIDTTKLHGARQGTSLTGFALAVGA
jgi:hypothetical protein